MTNTSVNNGTNTRSIGLVKLGKEILYYEKLTDPTEKEKTYEFLEQLISSLRPQDVRNKTAEFFQIIPPHLICHLKEETVSELGVKRLGELSTEQLDALIETHGSSEFQSESLMVKVRKGKSYATKSPRIYTLKEMLTQAKTSNTRREQQKKNLVINTSADAEIITFESAGKHYVPISQLVARTSLSSEFFRICVKQGKLVDTFGYDRPLGLGEQRGIELNELIAFFNASKQPQQKFKRVPSKNGRRLVYEPLELFYECEPNDEIPVLKRAGEFAPLFPRASGERNGQKMGINSLQLSRFLKQNVLGHYKIGSDYFINQDEFERDVKRYMESPTE